MDKDVYKSTLENIKKSPLKGFAKNLTLIVIALTYVIGIIGSFEVLPFNMEKFIAFLPVFAYVFVPLLVSIGASKIVEKVEEQKTARKQVGEAEYQGRPGQPGSEVDSQWV